MSQSDTTAEPPKSTDRVQLTVWIPRELSETIDRLRGDETKQSWVQRALTEATLPVEVMTPAVYAVEPEQQRLGGISEAFANWKATQEKK